MRSELLRLNECPAGQFLTGNTHGEPEVVLYPGARSGLPTRCMALHDQHVQTLGGSIDRGGQPAWSRADHDQVVHRSVIDSRIQPKACGRLRVAGISKHEIAAADQDGNVFDTNLEVVEHRLNIGIVLHIDVRVWMAIAREERPKTQGVAGMAGSNEYGIAHGMG